MRYPVVTLFVALASACAVPAGATDKEAEAVLDKAIGTLGGEKKLGALKTASWKAKCKMSYGDTEDTYTTQVTVQGLDRYREAWDGEFMGVTVLAGDKGWSKFGDEVAEVDEDELAEGKRSATLRMVAISPLLLKGEDYKLQMIPEQKVGDKPAVALKVTGPDQAVDEDEDFDDEDFDDEDDEGDCEDNLDDEDYDDEDFDDYDDDEDEEDFDDEYDPR